MFRDAQYFRSGLLLIVISSTIGLLVLEYLFVPFYMFRGVDRDVALMGFYVWPNLVVDDTTINSQGFTGHNLSEIEGSPSTTRILTLGGSTMFNRRMTERMIDSWEEVFPTVPQVVGGALRTHTSRASVIKYQYYFSKYRFDYVLIYHAINDLWANNIEPASFVSDYSHQNPWSRRNFLVDNLILARLAYNQLNPGTGAFPGSLANNAKFKADKSFEHNLRTLVASVREKNGKPVLMTFAWHIPDNYSYDSFERGILDYDNPARYDYCPIELWGDVAYVEAGLSRYNSIIRKLATELRVDLIDQFDNLSHDPRNFGDPVHFSETGTDRFISAITDYFRRKVSQ